jgi:hypothetical protein
VSSVCDKQGKIEIATRREVSIDLKAGTLFFIECRIVKA